MRRYVVLGWYAFRTTIDNDYSRVCQKKKKKRKFTINNMTYIQWNLVLRDQIEYRVVVQEKDTIISFFFNFCFLFFNVRRRSKNGKIVIDVVTFFEFILTFLCTNIHAIILDYLYMYVRPR